MAEVVVVGSVTVDEQARPDGSVVLQVGGVTTYGAVTLFRRGVSVVSVFASGGDRAPVVLHTLADLGVSAKTQQAHTLTTFRNNLDNGEGRSQELLAVAPEIRAETVQAALDGTQLVYLGPVHAEDLAEDVFPLLTESGVLVSLDIQGLLRTATEGPVNPALAPTWTSALKAASIIKADVSEAALLERFSQASLSSLLREYSISEAVITEGSKGGYVLTSDGRTKPYTSELVARIHDTTGAGDVFFGTYLAERVLRKSSIEDACQAGASWAARQVSGQFIRPEELLLRE
jgi:sugar/nucleoside kinase (ribokinase family)